MDLGSSVDIADIFFDNLFKSSSVIASNVLESTFRFVSGLAASAGATLFTDEPVLLVGGHAPSESVAKDVGAEDATAKGITAALRFCGKDLRGMSVCACAQETHATSNEMQIIFFTMFSLPINHFSLHG